MSEIKVSIVVPVYNTSEYLHDCMDSIINQSLKEIEIICVDDGSTDNSLDILNEYAEKDSRVKVISIENSGLSIARNTGIKQAKGEYLGFVDSDDYVHRQMFEKLYLSCKKNDLDLSMCKISLFDNETGEVNNDLNYYNLSVFEGFDKKVFNSEDTTQFTCNIAVNAYNKLYRKSLLFENSILFPPNLIFEDEIYFIKSYLTAKRISVVNEFLYYYRINRQGSITYLNKENNYVDMVCIYRKERKIFKDLNRYDEYKIPLANRMLFLILVRYTQTHPKYKENFYNVLKKDLKRVLADEEIKNNLSVNIKNRVMKIYESESYEEFVKADQYKIFSVVLISHNSENYINAVVNSVLNQHFSFESNIQLILVNNGSEDNTGEICSKYKQLYPENIVYIDHDKPEDIDTVKEEVKEYIKGDHILVLDEPHILNRDALSSIVLNFNKDTDDDLVYILEGFEDDFDKAGSTYDFRDLDSSGDYVYKN